MTTEPVPVALQLKTVRIFLSAAAGGLVMFGVVVQTQLPNSDYPPIGVAWALGGLAVISHLLSRTLGFRLRPVPAGTLPAEAMEMAKTAFHASTILRLALSEAVAIIALILTYIVLPASWMTYLIGGTLALILMGVNVWPRKGLINKAEVQLDRDGGQSYLGDALLGLTPGTTSSAVVRT
jgi:hypothetical protein